MNLCNLQFDFIELPADDPHETVLLKSICRLTLQNLTVDIIKLIYGFCDKKKKCPEGPLEFVIIRIYCLLLHVITLLSCQTLPNAIVFSTSRLKKETAQLFS